MPTGSATVLVGAATARPTFSVDKPGVYTVQLIVSDGQLNSAPSTVTITTVNSPPVANAGANQTVFVNSLVRLDGSGSSDVDGDPLTYQWSLTTVPDGSTAQLSDPTAVKPTFTADVKGLYVAELFVNDGHVNSAPATVTVSTVNSPPVANAGPNQTLQAGRTVNLDGSKSSDVDGDPLTFRWSILSTPAGSSAVLSDPSSVRPSFFADEIGTYIIQLVVNDGMVDSAAATVTITTQNTAPIANDGPNQSVFVGSTVTLNGSASTDVDGDPLTYRWSLLSVPTGSAAQLANPATVTPSFVVDVKGTYIAQLIVNDGFVDSAPATVTISTLNSPPVANAGSAQTVLAGTTIQLNGSRSSDVDGDPLTFKWSIISKPSNSSAVLSDPAAVAPTFFADQLGIYVAQLIVNDGTVDSAPSTVTITTEDSPPAANAGPAQTVPLHAPVTLDGSGSFDPDGQTLTYQWSLLSVPAGSTAVLANGTSVHPTFTADKAGNYVAQLIVNDGFLSSAPSTVTISTINSVPVADAGPAQSVRVGATVQLDGSASGDADGDSLTFRWSITVRPAGSAAALSDPAAAQPTFVADLAGAYVAQLIVNDGKVDSAPATVMITAQNPNQPPLVNAGPNQSITLPTNTVVLNGTATDDGLPSGTLIISWSQVSGPATVSFSSPNTAVTGATFTAAGTYVLRLSADDTQFISSSDVSVVVNPSPVNQPPVVSAGPGGEVSLPNSFQLNGSATDDGLPDGKLILQWTQVTGPSTAIIGTPTQPVTIVAFDAPGKYVFRLTASDTQLTSSADATVIVLTNNDGNNQPPFVDAGPAQTVTLPNAAALNGTAVDDGLPNGTLLIAWTKVSGPGNVVFADPTNPKTTATFSVAGDYILQLSASDSQLVSSSTVQITAQQLAGTRSSKGNEFWLMFNESLASGTPSLFITSETNASGTVSVPGIAAIAPQNFSVLAGQIVEIDLPTAVFTTGSDTIQRTGIHVVADHEVTVYGSNFVQFAADAYLGLPVSALGKEYVVASYFNVSNNIGTEFGIVAPYDNTTVTVNPTVTAGGHTQGVPYTVVLHQGRTYQLQTSAIDGDFTGTIISSDKPVAVFGAQKCGDVPVGFLFCNHMVEQMPSTDTWGTHFATVPLAVRKGGDVVRIVGATDGTNVSINGQPLITINRGQFYESLVTQPSFITSDHPIMVVQYSHSATFDDPNQNDPNELGDPFMIVVPPVEQYRGSYTVTSVQPTWFLTNFVNIVIPIGAKQQLLLDGAPVNDAQFTDLAGSGYSTAQISVSPGSHRLVSTVPFGVFMYGYHFDDGYGYTGGIALSGVPGGSVSLFPGSSTQSVSTQACVVASVADSVGNPLSATKVDFTVTGANPQSGSVDTDINGQSQFCYVGANPGTDSITGSIATATAASTVNWQLGTVNQPPQVSLPSSIDVDLPNSATLVGAVVDDGLPQGTGLTLHWNLVSGPGTVTFTNAAAIVTSATFSAAGTYVVQLSASDSQLSGSASTTVVVTDSRGNRAPVIGAIAPQTVDFVLNPSGSITLSPTVTDDGLPAGSKLSYNWTVTGGSPTNVLFANPTGASTSLVILDSGFNQTLTLTLKVDDSRLSSSANFTITTISGNRAPTVSAGAGGTITLPTNTFTLNGSATDDGKPVGGILTSLWQMIRGPAPVTFGDPTKLVTTVTFQPTPGLYQFSLTASDGQLSNSSVVSVILNPANEPPQVGFASIVPSTQTITLPTNVVTINGKVSDDGLPAGILNISWSLLSGPAPVVFSNPTQAITQVTFSAPGSYQLQLRADDSQLQTAVSLFISVNPQNQAPVVTAGGNQLIALPANTVSLQGVVHDDGLPAGAAVTQQWSEVSGPAAVTFSAPTSLATQATFSVAGTYDLRLTASDTQLTGSADVIITVLPAPQNLPPVVSAGLNQTATLPGPNTSVQVFLGGSVKDDGLPAGKPVTQQWSEVSGPAPVIFSPLTAPTTTVSFNTPGTYDLRLTASDTQLTGSADVIVLINPPVNQPPRINGLSVNPAPVVLPGNTSTFAVSVTDDGLPNGTLTFQWVQTAGPAPATINSPASASTLVTFPVAGQYAFLFTASDSHLASTTTVNIDVTPNQAPTVSISPNAPSVTLPNTLTLTATGNDDGLPNGQLTFSWLQTFGPATATFSNPTATVSSVVKGIPAVTTTQVSFPVPGTYQLQVTVSDGQIATTQTTSVTVLAPLPPLVVTLLSPSDGATLSQPTSVIANVGNNAPWTLSYSLTSGNDGDVPNWVQFASGPAKDPGSVLATFDPTTLLNGTYSIRLSATDSFGNQATSTVTVLVQKNVKVGDLTLSFNDLTVPVPGLPVQIIRTYDSRDKQQEDFGFGWSLGLKNVRLQKNRNLGKNWTETVSGSGFGQTFCLASNDDRLVTITFPDGRVYEFQAVSGPQCQLIGPITVPLLRFAQIPTVPGTAGATLQPADGAALSIDGSVPGPQNIIDFDGNIYNPTLFQLTTAEGFTYIIDQHFGATSVTDPNGNKIAINANGITSSTGISVAFVRDAQNRITQITDATGLNVLKYTYNTNGDLTSFTDAQKNVTNFIYGGNHLLDELSNGLGAIQAGFDNTGHMFEMIDSFGHVIRYNNNLAANQETITDRAGNPTTYQYDNDGNVVLVTDALGHTTSATYDANDNKLTETNALGKTTSYTYDSANNRLTETDPLGNLTRYSYNGRHQVLTVTDPLGHVSTNSYDPNGNLLATTDPLGKTTTYTYNAQGQPLTVKDPLGNLTTFAYDANGRVTQQKDALGNISSFTYDANGNKLTQAVTRTKSDGTKETLTTQYQYDGNNRLVKTINPDLTSTSTTYNAIGKPSDVFDALNRKTHYDYDANGRLTRTTYPDLTTESTTYDANDRRLTFTDRANRVTSYTYDLLGRLTKTTYPDLTFTQTVYDAAGQTLQTMDALNHATSYAYDDAGRRTSVSDALNNATSFAYDAAGNQTSMTDALNHTTQFVYDAANRRVQTLYPDQTSDSVGYDDVGRQISKTDQAGKITQFGYDPLGRLSSVTQFLNGLPLVTSYAYDELGNRISQTDANGHVTKFAYDQLGRRISRTLPLGMSESYGYDAVGNLTSRKDFNGHTTAYAYDTLNRLLSKTADAFFSTGACAGGLCGATKVSFTYTATGRRLSMTDASGLTNYTYDNRDRLLTKATPFGTLTYTYDGASNVLTLKSSNTGGASMTYAYDPLNRLSSVTDASGVTSYSYDPVGNLAGFAYPNGIVTSYGYDPLNRLLNMQSTCGAPGSAGPLVCGTGGTALSSYAYTLGPAGNRLSVAELSGRTVNYGYDDLYRLTSETIGADPHGNNGQVSYTFDNVGNRLQRNSTLPAIPATGLLNYDANDRTSTDPYDANGNLLNGGAGSNVYDFENHLVAAGGVTLVYDGDGNRVKETVATTTTSFLVADQNLTGYAQVMDELQNGAVSRAYSYGLELISQKLTANGQGLSFYGYDGHGSVRFLTSSTGTITDTYDFDAFGNLISQTGTTPNNYLFAGEQFDPVLGIYYNRARYYDQRQGRFWSTDRKEGSQENPRTLHKYLYANDNPVTFLDPSGLDFVSDFTTGLEVQQAIGAQFRAQFGSDGCFDRQIINILASDCGAPRDVGLPFPGGLRPDLANVRSGALFEIKPIKSAANGLLQLFTYRAVLALADPAGRNWHLGSASEFTPATIVRLGISRVAYVAPPVLGVIVYFVADARDAFDLSLLLASRILPAVLGAQSSAAAAATSNVISITRGVGIAGAAAQAEGAEIKTDVGTAILEDAA